MPDALKEAIELVRIRENQFDNADPEYIVVAALELEAAKQRLSIEIKKAAHSAAKEKLLFI